MAVPAAPEDNGIRQNYHKESEDGVNKQINMELRAFYEYLSLASYFERYDVALAEFAKFFKEAAHEELEHAEDLMKYQSARGGTVVLEEVPRPNQDCGSVDDAMKVAMSLERGMNYGLLQLHKIADKHQDAHLCNYLEKEFLNEQVSAIKRLGDHITNLKRVGPGHGVYHFDKETLGEGGGMH